MNCGGYELRIWAKDEKSINDIIALSSIFLSKHEDYERIGDYFTKHSSWKRLPDRIGSDYNKATKQFESNDRRLYVAQVSIIERHTTLTACVRAVRGAVETHPEILAAAWDFEPDGMWDMSGALFDTRSEGVMFSGVGDASMEDFDNYLRKR